MPDNTQLNTGTGGDTIATDEIAGIKFQRVKLIHGSDGTNDGDVASSNPLPAKERRPSGSSLSNVSTSITSVTVLASNANRLGAIFWNDSSFALYLKLGSTASLTSCTTKIEGGAVWALPHPAYTGVIDGIWDGAVGAVRVTELT